MSNIWFVSDTHFNHKNILTFTIDDRGTLLRPEFSSVEEMDETMIENWNRVVQPTDKVYHLGDVGFNEKRLAEILVRLNGKKRLLLGNHDSYKMSFYSQFFKKIAIWRKFSTDLVKIPFVATHVPILLANDHHVDGNFNVHGHVHEKIITDPRYLNICVEQTGYTPVSLEEIQERLRYDLES